MSKLDNLHNPETQDTSYDHVLRYTSVFGGVQGLKMAMAVLRNKVTSVLLSSVGMGLMSVYSSISEFIVSSCNFGLPLNATRITGELFEEGTAEQIRHSVNLMRTCTAWSAVLATLLCTLFSPLLSYMFFDHDWRHFPEVMLLIPVIVCYLVAECECSILKGLRQIRTVAVIESVTAVLTIFLTIPFYLAWGIKGVVMGLIACGLASVVAHFYFSLQLVQYRIMPFNKSVLHEGIPIIRKGIPYVLAGIANSLVAMAIPAIMLQTESLEQVGFYRAGYALMVGYTGMAFVALEADYFPRLSSVCHDRDRMNATMNQQIDVCVMLLTPILILIVLFMPWIILLLHTEEFLIVNGMATIAVFYAFFRCIYLPAGYITLAKGDSLLFFCMEVLFDVIFVAMVWVLYRAFGLTGIGIALSLGALYDVVCALTVYGFKYGCRVKRSTWRLCLIQFALLCLAACCAYVAGSSITLNRLAIGIPIFTLSLAFSLRMLSDKSKFLKRIFKR